ncbi:MAG: metallophosphoesterase family protein [Pseudomonadota bacterium]
MQQRSFRWGILGFFLFLLLLSAGRVGQVYLDSRLQGVRGPYLQMPTADAITIRWQTLNQEKGVVRYGSSPDELNRRAEGGLATVHEVRLSGLNPDTAYYYSVDETVYPFRTSPLPGSDRPVRLWVQGDPGLAIPSTMQGRDAAIKWAVAHPRDGLPPIDLWLTTGDNAYRSGKDEEFQRHLFNAYPKLLPTLPYLPVHGNHDARRNAFYKLFTFPEKGEAGGVASGSEHYFSIDYGQLHLIFLDSHDGDLDKDSAMLRWLKKDLETTKQPWIVALLHHPPYTKGSHDSDDDGDSRGRMRRVRENVLPLLELGGVDVALFGHSHVYERSHLMACHYGTSDSFKSAMNLQHNDKGQYEKSITRSAQDGIIYNVVGSSARANSGPLDHPAMTIARSELGSLLLDIDGNKLSAIAITPKGKVFDRYEIRKDAKIMVEPRDCGVL